MDNLVPFLTPRYQRLDRAGYLLGFALGGFFDGILLHQILQWHHLLSGVERAPFTDLRMQILADGLFHALMYVIAAIGIWKLVKARYVLVGPAADRALVADTLIGFGAWHIVDSLLSHWILGIHRIRMDSPSPLLWDLLWFVVFGVLFVAAGMLLRRRGPPPSEGDGEKKRMRSTFAPMLAAGVAAAGFASALAPSAGDAGATVTVLLRPGATPAQLLSGLQQVNGRVVWSSARGEVWVFALDKDTRPMTLYRHGAMLVSGTLLPAGCSSWVRT
ncbi:MAG TPA: DUF2243 domain-containing protein [Noviherbaspirillum sp.]